MKDKVTYGNKVYKKIIAQELEKVYPQLVSQHRDFIPNVYQATTAITKTHEGYLVHFNKPHGISGDAKKLQVLYNDSTGMESVDIVSIPSGNEIIIKAGNISNNKIFVYGEEVGDFRTVDYEGLTTLNISATQEMYRLLQKEKEKNTALEKRILALEESMRLLLNQAIIKNKIHQ